MKLSTYLFWDTDIKNIDWEKHSGYVIERVISLGTLNDWKQIIQYYGLERIKKDMLRVRYLDKLTLNFCSTLFNIPKEKYRCYKHQQLTKQHWDL